jgi:hypothetical protein
MKPNKITIDLKALRQKLTYKSVLSEAEKDLLSLMDAAKSSTDFAGKLSNADECTIVTNACGSCSYGTNQGYLIEYYCGSGGSDPDFARCEAC